MVDMSADCLLNNIIHFERLYTDGAFVPPSQFRLFLVLKPSLELQIATIVALFPFKATKFSAKMSNPVSPQQQLLNVNAVAE